MIITSHANEKLKHLKKLLTDKDYRHEHGEYAVEGLRVLDGIRNVRSIFVREGTEPPVVEGGRLFVVARDIFNGLSATENSQGIIVTASMELFDLSAVRHDCRYVLFDRVQDPGNMGAILRCAAAFGCRGAIVLPGCADPFSPKAVRAAASALWKLEIIRVESPAALSEHLVIAADADGTNVSSFSWPQGFILAVGNEANGISDEVRALAKEVVAIPIAPSIESLNAAVSAGILLFAASTGRKA